MLARFLPDAPLTATYEQRQAYIDFLINKIIAVKNGPERPLLEHELTEQIHKRGPERVVSNPPEARLLEELRMRKFGEPLAPGEVPNRFVPVETEPYDQGGDPPVPTEWPEDAEEDPGGYGFPL